MVVTWYINLWYENRHYTVKCKTPLASIQNTKNCRQLNGHCWFIRNNSDENETRIKINRREKISDTLKNEVQKWENVIRDGVADAEPGQWNDGAMTYFRIVANQPLNLLKLFKL